ncbi:MAG: ORF6N domain-containing protein [Steroidobacteraceae bacterium]
MELPDVEAIECAIHVIRGQRVMLDSNLARLYGVSTTRLNQQVRRNLARFPPDFMLGATQDEWQRTLLQNATTLHRSRRLDRVPLAFTEHGCLMVANVLPFGRGIGFTADWPDGG